MSEPLSPEFRQRLMAAVERPLRVRRAIITLAAHATKHFRGCNYLCSECHKSWPCPVVMDCAREALNAVTDLRA